MKYELSRHSAATSACAAVVIRLFWGVMLDPDLPTGGAWLSVLIGLLLALPVALSATRLRRSGLLAGVLLPLLLTDAAATMECVAFSESYLAYSHMAIAVLLLPLLLSALRCSFLGGNALGASARVWMYVLAALLIVVMVCQFPRYRPAWLFPILGSGPVQLLALSLRTAGWTAMLFSSPALLCPEEPRQSGVSVAMAMATVIAALLIAMRLMMTPFLALNAMDRTMLLDSLLTNGRSPLTLQLPMIVIWFLGMLHLFCFECFLCAALLKRCVHSLPYGLCSALTAALIFAMALFRLYDLPALSWLGEMASPLLIEYIPSHSDSTSLSIALLSSI